MNEATVGDAASVSPAPLAVTPTSGGKSLGSITCAGAMTVSQWQMFSN